MTSERPLLTLAIPTFNRASCLSLLLEVLTPQVANEPRVEVLISDNASPDNTAEVVRSFCEKGLAIRYHRNEVNVGADANFIQCYEMAHGEYVWIFGDDDLIVPGGLTEVIAVLQTRAYDLMQVQAFGFRGAYVAKKLKPFTHRIKKFARPEDFALYASTSLTFISGIISRKAALSVTSCASFGKLIGTNLAQLSWTFALLKQNPRCACFLDRIVANRLENTGGHGTCQVFGTNLEAIVRDFFEADNPIGRAIINRTIQVWFPWAMLTSRRNRSKAHFREDAESILEGLYRKNVRYWVFLHPVLKLPVPLAIVWRVAGKVVNRVDGMVGYPLAR